MCCTLWLSTPVPPKGYSSTPGVPLLGTTQETHGRQRELEIATVRFGSAIWSLTPPTRSSNLSTPSSARSANAHFQPAVDLGLQAAEMPQALKMARYAPFDIDDTLHGNYPPCRFCRPFHSPGSQSPRDDAVHEECRITCDHRHSLWYLTGSLDCGLSRNAIRHWFAHDFVPMAAAPGIAASASLSGESRTLHFNNSLSHG